MQRSFCLFFLLLCIAVASPTLLKAQTPCQSETSVNFGTAIAGQPITVTISVSDNNSTIASGTVYYSYGTLSNLSGLGSGSVTLINGSGTAEIGPLAAGGYTFYAIYSQGPCQNSGPSEPDFYVYPAGGKDGGLLKGSYALLFKGQTNLGNSRSSQVAEIGSLIADGSGNISGALDVNSTPSTREKLDLRGTYTINGDGTSPGIGTMSLSTSDGTQSFNIFTTDGQLAKVIETDQNVLFGNGILYKQTLPEAGSSLPAGSYQIELNGEVSCSTGCSGRQINRDVFSSGIFFSQQTPVSVTITQTIGTSPAGTFTLHGASSAVDTYGRFTFTLELAGGESVPEPTNFIGYFIDSTHFVTMSADPHRSYYLLSGLASQ